MAKKSYQKLKAELDEVVASLQSDELDIDQASKAYEQGIRLVSELEAQLKTTQAKIKKITKKG